MLRWKYKLYGSSGFLVTTGIVGGLFGKAVAYALLGGALSVVALVAGFFAWRHWEKHTVSGQLQRYIRLQTAQIRKLPGFVQAEQATYLVLGPSFVGKSQLLEQSGLKRVADLVGSSDLKIAPPTFWMGDEGIYVELSGTLLEAQALGLFTTTLHRLRARRLYRNIKGVVLCLEAGVLQRPDPHVESLRAPVEHVAKCFGRRPPVYLMLTQTDQIPGFSDVFGALADADKNRPWGLSLGADGSLRTQVQAGFGCMLERLRAFALMQLSTISQPEGRIEGYCFAERIAALAPGLAYTLEAVFAWEHNIYAPSLRGVYFSASDTDKLVLPQTFATEHWDESAGVPQSYFGGAVLRSLLPEAGFTTRAVAYPGLRGLWQRCQVPLALTSVACLFLLWQVTALLANRGLIGATERAMHATLKADTYPDEAGGSDPSEIWLSSLESLSPLRRQLARLESYEVRGVPWYLGCGLFQGQRLHTPLRQAFMARMQATVLEPVYKHGLDVLNQHWQRYSATETALAATTSAQLAHHLKAHLLMTAPKDDDEPLVRGSELAWLQRHLKGQIAEVLKIDLDDTDTANFNDALRHYAMESERDAQLAWPRDPQSVSYTRSLLNRMPTSDLLIAMLDADVRQAHGLTDLGLDAMLGSIASPLRSAHTVAAIFTREGYESVGHAFIEAQKSGGETWVVLARTLRGDGLRRHALQVEKRYYERYIDTWQQLIDNISLIAPRDAAQALSAVVDLTRNEPPPIVRLFAAIAHNTRLSTDRAALGAPARHLAGFEAFTHRLWQAARALTEASADAAEPVRIHARGSHRHPVEQAFSGFNRFGAPDEEGASQDAPLRRYQDRLLAVRQALQSAVQDSRESDRVLTLVQQVQQETSDLIAQSGGGIGVKPRLETLLLQPLRVIAKSLARGARVYRGDSYCASVVEPFAALRHNYPFDPAGLDAPLADVLSFFRPETGHLWRYYNKELAQDILPVGEHFGFDSRLGGAMRLAYAPELLDYLNQAQSVSRALFADGQEGMTFEVRLKSDPAIERIDLEVSGVQVPYGTQEWTSIQWPGPKPSQGAQLVITAQNGMREMVKHDGAWGLFRLLESGRVRGETDSGVVRIEWPLAAQHGVAQLEVRTLRRQNLLVGQGRRAPLWGALRDSRLVPPSRVAQGVTSCRTMAY